MIVNYFTSVKSTDFHFSLKSLELRSLTVGQVNIECTIYEILSVKGLVYNLKNETAVSKEGYPLHLRKRIAKVDQDKISLVLIDGLIDGVENNKCYEFKKLIVQTFMNERLLKSNETLTTLAIKNQGIQLTEDEAIESEKSRIQEKVLKIDTETLVPRSLCPECNSQVEIENVTPWCKGMAKPDEDKVSLVLIDDIIDDVENISTINLRN